MEENTVAPEFARREGFSNLLGDEEDRAMRRFAVEGSTGTDLVFIRQKRILIRSAH